MERAGTNQASGVTAQVEMMQGEPAAFGPRSFSDTIHRQNLAEMQIIEITVGVPGRIGSFAISEPVPLNVLLQYLRTKDSNPKVSPRRGYFSVKIVNLGQRILCGMSQPIGERINCFAFLSDLGADQGVGRGAV